MNKKNLRTDVILWTIIVLYTGLIYSTLSIVSVIRKGLEEKYGPDVYNGVYWLFAALALGAVVHLCRNLRGKRLAGGLSALVLIALVYWYYLSSMPYPAEKIHFVEYGLLGALVLATLKRRCCEWIAIPCAAAVVYWAGLGDETIQWAIPGRVGEIRDSVINLISGILGIAALQLTAPRTSVPAPCRVRSLPVIAAVTTILTALFLYTVHGFGYMLDTREPGRIYSAFNITALNRINSEGFVSTRDRGVYENEAIRHLHQRSFYLTNDFKGRDGTFYRIYDRALFENAVLETFYTRYLNDNCDRYAGQLLSEMDPEVSSKVMKDPVLWPDSLRQWVGARSAAPCWQPVSRVKSTIITPYKLEDLLFYVVLILFVCAYAWIRIGAPRR